MLNINSSQFNQLRHGGYIDIPQSIAVCPECGGALHLQNDEWNAKTGMPTQSGFSLDCMHEEELLDAWADNDEDDRSIEEAGEHRHWQSDWQPVRDRIWEWLKQAAVAAW